MVILTFNDKIFSKIINNLITSKCEIDPMSFRYSAVLNLYNYLKKENNQKLEIVKKILREELKNNDDNFVKIMEEKINILNTAIISYYRARELYKLNKNDLDKGDFTVFYLSDCIYYKKEDILNYLYENLGQEKVDARRVISEKRSNLMSKMVKERSEKRENLVEYRRQEVLTILDNAGLFYPRGLYIADYYIDYGGILNVPELLKKANELIKKERDIEKRKENLYEELEKYECLDMKKNRICINYYNGILLTSLEDVVNFIRELKWLNRETEYEKYLKERISIEKYDSLLGRIVKIRNYKKIGKLDDRNDVIKTFVIEKYLKDRNWCLELVGEVPPYIKERISYVFDNLDSNMQIQQSIEKERQEKKELLRKKELEKKNAKKKKSKETSKKNNVVIKET